MKVDGNVLTLEILNGCATLDNLQLSVVHKRVTELMRERRLLADLRIESTPPASPHSSVHLAIPLPMNACSFVNFEIAEISPNPNGTLSLVLRPTV